MIVWFCDWMWCVDGEGELMMWSSGMGVGVCGSRGSVGDSPESREVVC